MVYAATTYGVELSIEQAESFRDRLIGEVDRELGESLNDDPIEALAHNLKTSGFRTFCDTNSGIHQKRMTTCNPIIVLAYEDFPLPSRKR